MDASVRPVFIIGAARSGTKFVRSILAFSRECSAVPYDVNYVWRFGNDRYPDDALPTNRLTPDIITFIRTQLPRLAEPRLRQHHVLVEKTVSNGLRVDFVNAVFPEARFIHLVRDGREVIESAMRMWNAPPDAAYLFGKLRRFPLVNYRYALWYAGNLLDGWLTRRKGVRVWGPRYPGIENDLRSSSLIEICARQWSESVRRTLDSFRTITHERRITVRYEQLTRDPVEVERLCSFVDVADIERVLEGYHRTVAPPQVRRWPPPTDRDAVRRALAIAEPELRRLGYLAAVGH